MVEKVYHRIGGYVDCGSHFIQKCDGRIFCCLACDQPIEFAKEPNGSPGSPNHHCPSVVRKIRRKAARRSYDDRLAEGVELLAMSGDYNEDY